MAGLWCVNIGYGRRELADAAHRQMLELPYYNSFFQCTHPPAVELASAIAEQAPAHMNRVFFTGSGSEANDTVLRMVRRYWDLQGQPKRKTVISRINGYHGDRKSTRLNSSHVRISYAVFCLKKKKKN